MVLNELLEQTRRRRVPRPAVRWRVDGAPKRLFAYARPAGPDGRGIGDWPVAAIDVETTGLSGQDRVVEIAVVRVEPDGGLREYATLLNPDRDPGPVFIHQITASQVRNAPRFADVAGDVLALLDGAVVAAHNASFEDRFLTAELARCGVAPAAMPAVCTLEFARHGLPRLPNHKLVTVADACGVVLEGAHTALGDARAVAGLLASLVKHITPELPVTPAVQGFVPARVRPVTRTGRFNKGEGWIVSLLNRLPLTTGDHEPLEVDAYLEALDRALADGRLIGAEARMLARTAGEAGLGQDVIRGLHRRYLDACRDAALEDDVLTPAELRQLNNLSQLLGEPDYFADLSPTPSSFAAPQPWTPEPRTPEPRTPAFGPATPASVERASATPASAERAAPKPASVAAEPAFGPARTGGKLGGERVWFSPACPTELARAVIAAGGRRAVHLTRSCVAAVVAPSDTAHPAHERATALGIPVLTPDDAWSALELTPVASKTSATLEAAATTDEAAIRETLIALGLTPATLEPAPAADRGGSKTDAAASSARDRAQAWGEALLEVLLPLQPQPGTPVLLACDDETIARAGDRLAVADDPASVFAGDVTVAFSIGSRGLGRANAGRFRTAPRPRPLPEFFPVLCLLVLAASRMEPDEHPTHAYYPRLRDLLGIGGEGHIEDIEFVHPMFECLADWLENDLAGARGRLVQLKEPPTLRYVGTIVSQTVFRRRDRQVLTEFFDSRPVTFEDADPLQLLRQWPHGRDLTENALRQVFDDEVADQVRAAIRAADPHTGHVDRAPAEGGTLDEVPFAGPTVSRPDLQDPPVARPSPAELFAVHADGTLERHVPPPEPSWPGPDGQDGLGDGVVWVLCPDPPTGEPWARLQRGEMLQRLAPDAAEVVHAMQHKSAPSRTTRPGISRMYGNAAWNSLVRRAFFTLSGQRGRHPWLRDLEQHPVRERMPAPPA